MTNQKPPSKSPAQIYAFWCQTCHCRPKMGNNYGFSYIFGFSLFCFGFGLVQITYLTLSLTFPAQVHAFRYPTCHCRAKIGQNHGFGYIFGFGLGWLVLDWFQWRIWGCHGISQLKHMLFGTEHVTVGQKMAKTMILALFLALAWLGWVLVIILVQILNAMAKTVPMKFHTPQLGLKLLTYPEIYIVGLEFCSSEKSEKLFLQWWAPLA